MKAIAIYENNEIKHLNDADSKHCLENIIDQVYQMFKDSGIDLDDGDELHVGFDGRAKNPVFYNNRLRANNTIILAMDDIMYWSQLIYQFSHEMMHYCVFLHNNKESKKALWLEETICEATSLFALSYMSENWEKTKLNETYSKCIDKYLEDCLREGTNDVMAGIASLNELEYLDKHSKDMREDRRKEMHNLYKKMTLDSLKVLCVYRDYIVDSEIFMDTKRYRSEYPDDRAVQFLCDLQDDMIGEMGDYNQAILSRSDNRLFGRANVKISVGV